MTINFGRDVWSHLSGWRAEIDNDVLETAHPGKGPRRGGNFKTSNVKR